MSEPNMRVSNMTDQKTPASLHVRARIVGIVYLLYFVTAREGEKDGLALRRPDGEEWDQRKNERRGGKWDAARQRPATTNYRTNYPFI